jgi:transcription antitermination factor NusG
LIVELGAALSPSARNAFELAARDEFRTGEAVRVTQGPFSGQLGLYHGQRPHERVLVLLALLGGQQKVELPRDVIEVV